MSSTIFKEQGIYNIINQDGFYKSSLLDEEDLRALKEAYKELQILAQNSIDNQFWPSGRHPDKEVRNFAKDSIERVVRPKLETIINNDEVSFVGGTFLVKPPSRKSGLAPHQDSSHVDERKGFSVYAWIPLQDVNRWNGCFHYLPDSHHWGIHQRSLNVKWPLKEKAKILQKHMRSIPMKAGEVLFFHSALIHSSPANYTFKTRVAVNYYLHPKSEPFCHFYEDKNTPIGMVEMYSVKPEFFYEDDFEKKPNPNKYPLLEIINKSEFDENRVLKQLATK